MPDDKITLFEPLTWHGRVLFISLYTGSTGPVPTSNFTSSDSTALLMPRANLHKIEKVLQNFLEMNWMRAHKWSKVPCFSEMKNCTPINAYTVGKLVKNIGELGYFQVPTSTW